MKIEELPLPPSLTQLFTNLGYEELYPIQEQALRAGALEGRSLLLAAPTASGKTLVALMVAGNLLLRSSSKVVYLTPLKALANEKYEEFRILERLRRPAGGQVRVLVSTGDYDDAGEELAIGDVIIATNEKFDSLLRHGASWIEDVALFIMDEVHLIGHRERGPTLEMIATKVRHFLPDSQILALSATVSNASEVAHWLEAEPLVSDWRPVKLLEGIYQGGQIYFNDGSIRKLPITSRGPTMDVALDSIKEGGQVLVFTESRKRAVSLAIKGCEGIRRLLTPSELKRTTALARKIKEAGEETELRRSLSEAVANGVAFHHAGLEAEQRRIVEEGFREGIIKLLTATPTLAAGVNLPARRVVITSLMRYDSEVGALAPISVLEYKQMCGRAGRPQYDEIGETVIITGSSWDAEAIYEQYIRGRPEPLRSHLMDERAFRSHILATIASQPGISVEELKELLFKTFLAHQYRRSTIEARLMKVLGFLQDEGLTSARGERLLATDFGKRVSMLYIDPSTAVLFRDALSRAERIKGSGLGLLHLVVLSEDFSPRFRLRRSDREEAKELLENYKEEFLLTLKPQNCDYEHEEEFLSDFRSLLVMKAWMEEMHEDEILERYGVEPGDLRRAVESCDWLLYALGELARLLGRGDAIPIITKLRERIRYGIKEELLPLARLQGVGRVRARALYQAGFTTLEALREAPLERIARVPKVGLTIGRRIKEQLKEREN